MRWIKYIWILIVVYIVCSARTCNGDGEASGRSKEEYTLNLINSVKNVFASDSLTDNLLRAYEMTATEKLKDFADYLLIVSDTSTDVNFRHQSARLVRNMFVSDDVYLASFDKSVIQPYKYSLADLLSQSLSGRVSFRIDPVNINVDNPFTRLNDTAFIGNLSFDCKYPGFENQDTADMLSGRRFIDIHLLKRLNYFGDDTLSVWKVFLGNLE